MKLRSIPCLSFVFVSLFAINSIADDAKSVFGFTPTRATEQIERESAYEKSLNASGPLEWMQHMTVRPHNLGSPQVKANAEYIAGLFKSWGYDTEIETFYVLFPTPKTRALEQIKPSPFTASLQETVIGADSAAEALRKEALPPFNAYSADGDVTGALVYVNQGLPKDYEELDKRGIDVKGKIVIARYGGSWRGIKPRVAAEHGAIGCIIYNDPLEDGYAQGDAYPNGPFKHDTAVQRGSVQDIPTRSGDPLTPDRGATKNAKRLSRAKAETLMKIPDLPISAADALPLLRTLDGPVAPKEWRGALPITYRLGGGGGTVVHLKAEFNWDLVPCYDVIARMKGSERPDEWVIRGNHHDAWVIGARDPISGLVPLLEQARAFSELAKTGWRPKRTMIFCAWDGEEPGLLGSTEWVEQHQKELREHAVAYINSDGNSPGFLNISGSHTLETAAAEVARLVKDPVTGVTVAERVRSAALIEGTPEQKKVAKDRSDLKLGALGSGSDYTPFLQHAGVASCDIRFGGHGEGGEYHTAFDTFDMYTKWVDPKLDYAVALADVAGRLSLRLLDADVVPLDFTSASATFSKYVDEVVELEGKKREETEEFNKYLAEGRFAQVNDPRLPFVAPKPKDAVPHLNFAPLLNARDRLAAAAKDYATAVKPLLAGETSLDAKQAAKLDHILNQAEQALLARKGGLPRRPWYRHLIYAPGFYTGYGVKTLPGVREGIEERQWDEAQQQIEAAAAAIGRFADAAEAAGAAIK
jgi:N-acetylated-alpha-linked acidic dipeptidase